jgi:hypothetical protein
VTERTLVPVRTPNGETVVMSVVDLDGGRPGGEQQVSGGMPSLSGALKAVDDFTAGLRAALTGVAPDRTTVEFSIGFALQAGKLTALFADGTAEGTIGVTLEWDREQE